MNLCMKCIHVFIQHLNKQKVNVVTDSISVTLSVFTNENGSKATIIIWFLLLLNEYEVLSK